MSAFIEAVETGYTEVHRPKLFEDQTIMGMYGLDGDRQSVVAAQLGHETVKIVVSTEYEQPRYGSDCFVIHKLLLARHSRYFNTRFNNLIDRQILSEIVESIVRYNDVPSSDDGDAPMGYVSSFAENVSRCEVEAGPGTVREPYPEEVLDMPTERSHPFKLFVHWLYTQTLPDNFRQFRLKSATNLATVYALAERLDVPLLRRQCYQMIRNLYHAIGGLPSPHEARLVIEETPKTSMLRRFYVSLVAHAVIERGQKEATDEVLNSHPEFAREVADEVMARLRAEGESVDPNKDSAYSTDDSDSDFESSVDGEASSDDSAESMTVTEDEDDDTIEDEMDRNSLVPAWENTIRALDQLHAETSKGDSDNDTIANAGDVKIDVESNADGAADFEASFQTSFQASQSMVKAAESEAESRENSITETEANSNEVVVTSDVEESEKTHTAEEKTEQKALAEAAMTTHRPLQVMPRITPLTKSAKSTKVRKPSSSQSNRSTPDLVKVGSSKRKLETELATTGEPARLLLDDDDPFLDTSRRLKRATDTTGTPASSP